MLSFHLTVMWEEKAGSCCSGLWTIRMYRIFTCRQANYLPQQWLSFVLQWFRPYSSHLSSHLWPLGCSARQGHACTHADAVRRRGESLWTSSRKVLSSGQCVCTHKGDMLSVNVDCIRSGWPLDMAPSCDIKGVQTCWEKEKMRKECRARTY